MALIRQRTGFFANHPVLIATTAASGGVLLGAYVAMQIFAAPVPNEAKVPAAAPVADVEAAGEADREACRNDRLCPGEGRRAASDRCEGQTWPYLSRECCRADAERIGRRESSRRIGWKSPHRKPRRHRATRIRRPRRRRPRTALPLAPAVDARRPRAGRERRAEHRRLLHQPSRRRSRLIRTPPKPAVAAASPASPPRAAEPAPKAQTPLRLLLQPIRRTTMPLPTNRPRQVRRRSAEKRKTKQAKERAKKQERGREIFDDGDDGSTFAGVERGRELRERDDRGARFASAMTAGANSRSRRRRAWIVPIGAVCAPRADRIARGANALWAAATTMMRTRFRAPRPPRDRDRARRRRRRTARSRPLRADGGAVRRPVRRLAPFGELTLDRDHAAALDRERQLRRA